MKEYFKNYMVGNFKGVHEKQFDTLKISKWIGKDVSKRAQLAAQEFLINADPNLVPVESLTEDRSAALNFAGVADTLQGAAVRKRDNPIEESPDVLAWFHETSDRRQKLSKDIDSFFKSWNDVLNISSSGCGETTKVPMSTHNADLSLLGMTPVFMDLFWPFRFDVNVMNQRLAVYDLTKKIITDNETLKEHFFEELQDLQGMRLPVRGNQIRFSFGDEDVVDGLNRSRLVPHSKSYMKAGKHLFTKDEQEKILVLANKALDVINKTHSELYSAMVQMISSIAFFKDDSDLYRSGSITSALGLVWLDPRQEWTVPLMAEQIVHEFIHTSLYYAELVHGTYRDVSRLPEAQVMSAIRHVPRNYDKSLHAAYVSAGLITFHTRVGLFERAAQLAKTLPGAVQELNRVNAETDVLDESGRAMLDFLTDYICLTRV
ncbi:uncharacterized protein [Haliotis cracherodii]|uniref:uncharacterized protein n=1 Tax=Haliotis cracherodii TaxID=6455 RepID=UPI0039EB6C6B